MYIIFCFNNSFELFNIMKYSYFFCRAAINLTSRLLTGSTFSSQHSPSSLRIWQVRIALLLKLKQFTTVETEASAFGSLENNVDLYYEYYPEQYGARQGEFISNLRAYSPCHGLKLYS